MTNSDLIVTAGGEDDQITSVSGRRPSPTPTTAAKILLNNTVTSSNSPNHISTSSHPTTSNGTVPTSTTQLENHKKPEECVEAGLWEVEFVYYALGHRSVPNGLGNGDTRKQRRGKVYKCVADSEYKCFEAHDGTIYWPGDYVYVELSATEPYMIGSISSFRPVSPISLLIGSQLPNFIF